MTEAAPLNTSPLPVKLRIEDYLLLDGSGAFDQFAKTELIEGEIVFMNAQHRPHARLKMKLYDAIRDALQKSNSHLTALVEASIAMPDDSAPEPDIVLTSEPEGEGFIPLASVALIIEIADTTLDNDLGRKATLYASKAVPEYWVADVRGKVVHQLWAPEKDGYVERREVAFGEPIETRTLGPLTIQLPD